MKSFNVLVALLVLILACNRQEFRKESEGKVGVFHDFMVFGELTNGFGVISSDEMAEKYSEMTISDTIHAKFSAKVADVCQARGCWTKLRLKE